MGKNVLKSPVIVFGNQISNFLRLLAFGLLFIMVSSAKAEDVRMKILKEINMRIPHKSQWNISQTEFEAKHREYFDLVEQNQRRRLNSSLNYEEENIVRKKLYTFTHSGLKNSPSSINEIKNFNYNIYIPEEENKLTELEEASLRLLIVPRSCATQIKTLTLKVVEKSNTRLLKTEMVTLNDCLPNWIGLDLDDDLNLSLKSNFQVSLLCEECLDQNIELVDPYLNVIVNVKSRFRRRRADKKRRRRFPGKCIRHPWEVEFAKLQGFEYILQPKKFDAGLCAGKCNKHWNVATQHSTLQYMFSEIDKTIPKPCCAPSKLESLEILHKDEDNPKKLKVTVWNDTRILECACS